MEFGQVIEYNKRNNHAENEAGRLILDFFLFLKKVFYGVKASGLQLLVLIYFDSPQLII